MPEAPINRSHVAAIVVGCVLAAVLAVVNTYASLKSGLWDGSGVFAVIIGQPLLLLALRVIKPSASTPHAPIAPLLSVVQATASAGAAMPASMGISAVIPAIVLLHRGVPPWAAFAWGLSGAALCVTLAIYLAPQYVGAGYPFPAAAAVSTAIVEVSGTGAKGARPALIAAGLSGGLAFIRDRLMLIPPKLTFQGIWGIDLSMAMLGIGMLCGLKMGLSLLGGSLLAWLAVAPAAQHLGAITALTPEAASGWLLWPGIGLVVGASAVATVKQVRQLRRAAATAGGSTSVSWWRSPRKLALFGAVALVVTWLTAIVFETPFGLALLFTLVVVPTATFAARATATLGFVPLGNFGQFAQLSAAPLVSSPVTDLAAGGLVSSGLAQTGSALEAFQSGAAVGAPRRIQIIGMACAVLVGGVATSVVYELLTRRFGVGTEALPIPYAKEFAKIAELSQGGLAALPAYAGWAFGAALVVGGVLELFTERRLAPNALSMGLAFMLPASSCVAIAAGAVIGRLWFKERGELIGAGAMIGEALVAVVMVILVAAG